MTQKTVSPPNIACNPTDRYLAEVRIDGWLIDRAYWESETKANDWLESNTHTEIQQSVSSKYVRMINEWGK